MSIKWKRSDKRWSHRYEARAGRFQLTAYSVDDEQWFANVAYYGDGSYRETAAAPAVATSLT